MAKTKPEKKSTIGTIVQIQGVVIDVQFSPEYMPAIYEALTVPTEFTDSKVLILEVEQHLGDNRVRAIALGPTDGLSRGTDVTALGEPISVPVGKKTLGRIFNVVGEPIDEGAAVGAVKRSPIHRAAPPLSQQSTKRELLETGIKVVDLVAPFVKGGKMGLFGGAGLGKTVLDRKSTRLNSSHIQKSRMPSSA